ncbi:MAG: transposase, partial [Rhodospirillales bacterium]|nr:transposase [Rhodospirillales bacterium]
MPRECISDLFGFAPVEGRRVEASFDGGAMTSDAGSLLLGSADRAVGLIERFAACFEDRRNAGLIEHKVRTLVGQRVFGPSASLRAGLALGYEDLNDHDHLRHGPLLAVLLGKLEAKRSDCAPVAGKSTLNRLELSQPEPTKYHKISHDGAAIERLLVDLFVEAHRRAPRQIVLDLDATDDPLHGHQEGRFFHGYYDNYCYLPRYVTCGRHLLAAKLRRSNIDGSAGAEQELARNGRLAAEIEGQMERACAESQRTGQPARRFKDFQYTTRKSWSRRRRVIGKAEWTQGEANPRFVVTSLGRAEVEGRHLYEKVHCARGDMENRIKECQIDMFAACPERSRRDRTSTATMRANQIRLWLSSMAYVLLCALRRIGLKHTRFAKASCGSIRLALLKIGAVVTTSVRRIKIAMASGCPYQHDF